MTEQELLGMFIQERINKLIDVFNKSQPDKSEQEEKRILQYEIFIENLPDKEKQLVKNYIDSFSFLYQHGFMDGVKILKYYDKL